MATVQQYIGYDNIVNIGNVSATSTAVGFPATNMANPATNLKWKSDSTSEQYVTVTNTGSRTIDYIGIAGHNMSGVVVDIEVQATSGTWTSVLSAPFTPTSNKPILRKWDLSLRALAQTPKRWSGMATLDGNVYAVEFTGDIYKQTGGAGDFVALGQAPMAWQGIAAVGSDIYAYAYNGDIYKQTGGAGDFVALGQTPRNWTGLAALNGDIYACVAYGDIYKQTGGTGNFVALGQTSRNWRGMTTLNGSVYACVAIGDIYKQTGGAGDFVALGQTPRAWRGMTTIGSDIYACVSGGDIYKQTGSSGNFVALGQTSRTWQGITAVGSDIYVCAYNGDIYSTKINAVRLKITPSGSLTPQIGVLYAGSLMQLERGVYVGHTPITYGRSVAEVNGMAESGDFLGRIIRQTSYDSAIKITNMTPAWYRSTFEPFVAACKTAPFFYAWRLTEYAEEIGYCWVSGGVPVPENTGPRGMMGVSFKIEGQA